MARKRENLRDPDGADQDPEWTARMREHLLAWHREEGRVLPWRQQRDPYRVLVSELMLVQTTVAAVIPYFERFLARFPTVQSLAEADESDVLKLWEGLGYYRRARQLHEAARAIVRDHGGEVPAEPEALAALPGVGRYIAGAIRSFAFDQSAPILEANTQRVLARWLAWRGEIRSSQTQTRLWEAASRLVPKTGAGAFNEAFMDLGALICAPRNPACLFCPVARDCQAHQLGIENQIPLIAPKAAPRVVVEACALVQRNDRWLLVQAQGGDSGKDSGNSRPFISKAPTRRQDAVRSPRPRSRTSSRVSGD